jgi:hypothetical protein
MKQKVKRLIQDVQECADLLQHHGESTWSHRLREDLKHLRKHGHKALGNGLNLFEHAEDLATLQISRERGHLVNPIHEQDLNDHLDGLKRAMRSTCETVLAGCA